MIRQPRLLKEVVTTKMRQQDVKSSKGTSIDRRGRSLPWASAEAIEAAVRHELCCSWSPKVPELQLLGVSLPTGQKVPFPQTVHSSMLVMTPSFFVVPAGQGSAAAAPDAHT